MAIVLTVQSFGSSVWFIFANVIFNNNLHDLLSEKASVIGLAPAARTAWASRGQRLTSSPALLYVYVKSIDRVMYLGVGLAAGALVFFWGLSWRNILEIKKREALVAEKKAGSVDEGHGAHHVTSHLSN